MAAQVVGGAVLNAVLPVLLDKATLRRFTDFFRRRKLNIRLLQELNTVMKSVQRVLDDAEEKEITKLAVKKWLDDLKDAFFEADDLLDEIAYEATRLELKAESRSAINKVLKFVSFPSSFGYGSAINKVLKFVSFPSPFGYGSSINKVLKFISFRSSFGYGLEARLKEIVKTLIGLVDQKYVLGLTEIIGGGQSLQRIPTASFVERANIFGRERDREAIMEMLLSDDVNHNNNSNIISVVGMGGIGKITLAQLIYGDERVKGWVCVSEEFGFPRIKRDIVKEVENQISCQCKTLNYLRVELKKKLTGKKFLLVLDDVWNDGFTHWDKLLSPLKSGILKARFSSPHVMMVWQRA